MRELANDVSFVRFEGSGGPGRVRREEARGYREDRPPDSSEEEY